MSKITDVSIQTTNIRDTIMKSTIGKNIKQFQDELKIDLLDLLPDGNETTVNFKIKNTNSAMANAIRRTIISELPVWSLVLDEKSMETDDPYIRFDDMATRINALPINQDELTKLAIGGDPRKFFKFIVNKKNKTPHDSYVNSGDIQILCGNKDGKLSCPLFMSNIQLQTLRPGRYLKCNFVLERGYGWTDGSRYVATEMVKYKPSDVVPLTLTGGKKEKKGLIEKKGVSSLESSPKVFEFSYVTYENYKDPMEPVKLAISEIKRRLDIIVQDIKKYKNTSNKLEIVDIDIDIPDKIKRELVSYRTDIIELDQEGDTYHIKLLNESVTMSKLFSRYIYIVKPQIELVNDDNIHPSTRSVIINIQDKDAINLMIKAYDVIMKELSSLM